MCASAYVQPFVSEPQQHPEHFRHHTGSFLLNSHCESVLLLPGVSSAFLSVASWRLIGAPEKRCLFFGLEQQESPGPDLATAFLMWGSLWGSRVVYSQPLTPDQFLFI